MSMSTFSKLVFMSTLAFGCATAGRGPQIDGPSRRGQVVVHGPTARAVVAGPSTIHAYSEFAGGAIYAAPAVSGTDADCAVASRTNEAPLAPDRVVAFSVGAGQVACVASASAKNVELLWHDARPASADVMIARASR